MSERDGEVGEEGEEGGATGEGDDAETSSEKFSVLVSVITGRSPEGSSSVMMSGTGLATSEDVVSLSGTTGGSG